MSNGRILIVDDDPLGLDILHELLDKEYELIEASNGKEALEKATYKLPDLILMDVMMPEMDGFEACRRLKSEPLTKDIPVLFLTSRNGQDYLMKGFKSGASDYIKKPFNMDEVHARVVTHIKLRKALKALNDHNALLEETVKRQTRELVRKEREAAFSLMIQGIVHNLRNPLTSIMGGAKIIEMMSNKIDDLCSDLETDYAGKIQNYTEKIRKYRNIIGEDSEKMKKMLENLLARGKYDKNDDLEITDLNKLIKKEMEFLRADSELRQKIDLRFDFSKSPVYSEVVPGEISQVFSNLIRNAQDALHQEKEPVIWIETGKAEPFVFFIVADNGPGIPPRNLEKIYDPFYTTKPGASDKDRDEDEPTGTGLGLYTCKTLIESYDGKIEIDTTVDEGTSFTVYLQSA